MEKLEFRANVKFCYKLGYSFSETFRLINEAYGEGTYGRTTVYDWYKRFTEGRTSIEDDERSGRPSTSTNESTTNAIEHHVREINRRVTIRELSELYHCSIGSVHSVLHALNMHRVCSKFVPKLLTKDQQMSRVNVCSELLDASRADNLFLQRIITGDESWIYQYDPLSRQQSSQWKSPSSPTPKCPRAERSVGKVMLISFFDYNGMVHHEYLPRGETVNGMFYKGVMQRLRDAIRRKRRQLWQDGNWCLQHDNAPAHRSLVVVDYFAKHQITVLPHPPYSPDLAPNDFALYPAIKKAIKGHRYGDLDEVEQATSTELRRLQQAFFQNTFNSLQQRWQKCIDHEGSYFEGDRD